MFFGELCMSYLLQLHHGHAGRDGQAHNSQLPTYALLLDLEKIPYGIQEKMGIFAILFF